nr:sarcosine oxidase subunit gamma [Rhizobium sp. Khangiran2]
MADLRPITALGLAQPKSLTVGSLSMTENPGLALASLALRRNAEAVCPFGLVLPEPGRWVEKDGVASFWIGPGQWMLEAQGKAEEDFSAELEQQCPGHSVTEQTDSFVAFEISSKAGAAPIIAVMTKLVNLDPRGFTPGSATRTGLAHMNVFAIRRADDRLAVLGMRSLAASLWHELERALKGVSEVPA